MNDRSRPKTAPEAHPAKDTEQKDTGSEARNGRGAFLLDWHRRELVKDSAIDPDVVAERGYETITRPTNGTDQSRPRLQALKIPNWAIGRTSTLTGC